MRGSTWKVRRDEISIFQRQQKKKSPQSSTTISTSHPCITPRLLHLLLPPPSLPCPYQTPTRAGHAGSSDRFREPCDPLQINLRPAALKRAAFTARSPLSSSTRDPRSQPQGLVLPLASGPAWRSLHLALRHFTRSSPCSTQGTIATASHHTALGHEHSDHRGSASESTPICPVIP